MKEFSGKQAIGQAGEYLVGAVVAHELGWPYRMQPIADVGIDGEIEVLNEASVSTHGLLKVQVKSEDAGKDGAPSNEYVSQEDFEYWTLLALPVILCRPVLTLRKVFWLPASAGRRTEKLVAFDFREAPELTAKSMPQLRELSRPRKDTLDIFSGVAARLTPLVCALLETNQQEQAAFSERFFPEYEHIMEQLGAARGLARLFPELVKESSRVSLDKLAEFESLVYARKQWVERNRD